MRKSTRNTYWVLEEVLFEEIEEDWIELIFPYPPKGKTYSMIHSPGDEEEDEDSFYIFRGLSYDSIQFD